MTARTFAALCGTLYLALGDWKPAKTLEKARLDRKTLAAVTSRNARRFLGLPAKSR